MRTCPPAKAKELTCRLPTCHVQASSLSSRTTKQADSIYLMHQVSAVSFLSLAVTVCASNGERLLQSEGQSHTVVHTNSAEVIEGSDFCIYSATCDSEAVFMPSGEHGGFQHTCWFQDPLTWDRSLMSIQTVAITARAGSKPGNSAGSAKSTIVAFLENEAGGEIPETRRTLRLTSEDQTFVLSQPCGTPGNCGRAYWVDLRFEPPPGTAGTAEAAGTYVFYTVRFFGSPGVSAVDLPTPCSGPTSYPPAAPPQGISASDLGLILGLSLGIPLACCCMCACYLIRNEQRGKPIFTPIVPRARPGPTSATSGVARLPQGASSAAAAQDNL